MIDVSKIHEANLKVKELKKEIDNYTTSRNKLIEWIHKNCPHPAYSTTRDYCSGGYDYVSSVTITHICTLCDKVLKSFIDPSHQGHYS